MWINKDIFAHKLLWEYNADDFSQGWRVHCHITCLIIKWEALWRHMGSCEVVKMRVVCEMWSGWCKPPIHKPPIHNTHLTLISTTSYQHHPFQTYLSDTCLTNYTPAT